MKAPYDARVCSLAPLGCHGRGIIVASVGQDALDHRRTGELPAAVALTSPSCLRPGDRLVGCTRRGF